VTSRPPTSDARRGPMQALVSPALRGSRRRVEIVCNRSARRGVSSAEPERSGQRSR
jgi:hypothetical protein